jgi:tetratricopeptide (TPR) repeat protein
LKEKDLDAAWDYLKQTWPLAERGRFLLYNADSYNILAQVEMAAGNYHQAVKAAQTAFNLSICDGFPFAYQRGLEDAQTLLIELDAEVIKIPECDETKFSPMIEIEINPNDEFGA